MKHRVRTIQKKILVTGLPEKELLNTLQDNEIALIEEDNGLLSIKDNNKDYTATANTSPIIIPNFEDCVFTCTLKGESYGGILSEVSFNLKYLQQSEEEVINIDAIDFTPSVIELQVDKQCYPQYSIYFYDEIDSRATDHPYLFQNLLDKHKFILNESPNVSHDTVEALFYIILLEDYDNPKGLKVVIPMEVNITIET